MEKILEAAHPCAEPRDRGEKQPLRILLIGVGENDSRVIRMELQKLGRPLVFHCVKDRGGLMTSFQHFRPEVVLSDYRLHGFDGLSALAVAQELCPEAPFIFVSGVAGEEAAIESIKSGAADYVLKDKIFRLAPGVMRALREVHQRRQELTGPAREAREALAAVQKQIELAAELVRKDSELMSFLSAALRGCGALSELIRAAARRPAP